MAKRLMAVITSSGDDGPYRAQAKVYRDSEWDEWRVRYYHGDELLSYLGEESDSFHGDQADAMGTAEAGITPSGREVTYAEVITRRLDAAALKADQPDLVAQYTRPSGYRRLHFKGSK